MTLPMLQIMIGIGVGLIGFLLLRNPAIEAPRYGSNRRKQRQSDYYTEFIPHSQPGDSCVICLLEMRSDREMQYLRCGHAFHEECLKRTRMHTKHCPLCREKM